MFDRQYLFNPYRLKGCSLEELVSVLDSLSVQYRYTDMAYDVSFNINLLNNILLVEGEIIAKLQEDVDKIEQEANIQEAIATYELRQEWAKQNDEKPPAMTYFEAMARKSVSALRDREIKERADLLRFKKHYDGVENKMNGLKKMLEGMKNEVL